MIDRAEPLPTVDQPTARPVANLAEAAALDGAFLPPILAGMLSLLAGLLVGGLAFRMVGDTALPAEQWATRAVAFIAGPILLSGLLYVGVRGRALGALDVARLGVLMAVTVLVALATLQLLGLITFPADVLIWSESDFVADIIKLRTGYPLYTAQANNESFTYMPGAQVLTWLLASAAGHGDSVVAYRFVQLLFTVASSVVGALTVRRLLHGAGVVLTRREQTGWMCISVPALFLFATNTVSNPFTAVLHNDALNQLLTAVAFWLLIEYAVTRRRAALIALAVLPAIGLLVKQTSVMWVGLVPMHLWLFDAHGMTTAAFRRALAFGVSSLCLVAAAVAGCYAVWGHDFVYWTFTVLGARGVSPMRAVEHALAIAPYFAAGLFGGLMLLRGSAFATLRGPWVIWFLVLSMEAYTSATAWMLNHMGPGSLLAGMWLLAGGIAVWTRFAPQLSQEPAPMRVSRALAAAALAVAVLPALSVVRAPSRNFDQSATNYVRAIEREFDGLPAASVLLDAGSWVYMASGVIQKDRAPTIGERGYSDTGDFRDAIARINKRQYARILMRHYQAPDFWYEHESWPHKNGIGEALRQNYREVRRIPGVSGPRLLAGYLMDEITVLEPIASAAPTPTPTAVP